VRRYENAVRRRPAAAANWFRLGKLLLDLGEYRRAEAMLRRAVQRGPRFANYRFYLGEALAGGGKLAEAAGHFRFLANADPGLADPMPVADECDCRQNAVPGARPGLPRRRGGGAET
jgi:tetratricopeptide (TPR) repeat protein